MKKTVKYLILLLIVSACKDSQVEPSIMASNYQYFPTDSALWREFQITEIVIDKASNVYDTTHYFVKEVWSGIYVEATLDTMQILNRFMKSETGTDWQIFQIWRAGIQSEAAIQVEENIKFIKLKFPLSKGKTWNGNAYNRTDTLGKYTYEISGLDEPYEINDLLIDSVLTVTQKSEESRIDKIFFTEKFALGIGLIEKIQIDIYSYEEGIDYTIPIEERVTKGTIYTQKLINYGKD